MGAKLAPSGLLSWSRRVILRSDMSEHDPFDLDGQDDRADMQRRADEASTETVDADFVWLMSAPRGRRIVRRLLSQSFVFRSSFHPNTMEMSKREGAKLVGYWLLEQIERLCPESYEAMNKEHRTNV